MRSLLILTTLLSINAFANGAVGSPTGFTGFKAWADAVMTRGPLVVQPPDQMGSSPPDEVKFIGKTPTGQACALYVSKWSDEQYYLSVGLGPVQADGEFDPNNGYIGNYIMPDGTIDNQQLQFSPLELNFQDEYVDIQGRNIEDHITVLLDKNGAPTDVLGASTLYGSVNCHLN